MTRPLVDFDALVADLPPLVRVQRAAELWDVSARTIRSWIAAGRLTRFKTEAGRGGVVRIPRSEIRRLLEEMAR